MSRKELEEKEERRRFLRSRIGIWAEEKKDNSTFFHLLTNLSSGGFLIEKRLPFPVGSEVNLKLKLGDEELSVRGTVVDNYKDPDHNYTGAGVKFNHMDERAVNKIEEYLKDLKDPRERS
jgi:Tfp pilus assembly protein PilZ